MATRTEQVTIVVDLQGDEGFANIVDKCKQAGLDVQSEMEEIGLVTGSIDATHVTHLDRVPGVMAVERQRTYQLPPPESEVQVDDKGDKDDKTVANPPPDEADPPPSRRPRRSRGPRKHS